MARYIDADAFKQKLADKDIFFPALYKNELDEMPTADVVPKSEVERLRFNLEAVLEEIPETKREIARDIFEEIENIHEECIHIDPSTNIGYLLQSKFEHKLAELKKKYTEGEHDE